MFKQMMGLAAAWPFASYFWEKKREAKFWEENCLSWNPPPAIGQTKQLEILPLIDWYAANDSLDTEPGVSYLVKTDDNTILFDLGYNVKQEHPSPLMKNMVKLGVRMGDIDTIVISHHHVDHVGGMKNQIKGTFSLTNGPLDLSDKSIFLPPGVSRPGINTMQVNRPVKIGTGITSTGPIYSAQFLLGNTLFPMGVTPEQALAVDVKDKGIVLIVGCGHQRLDRILKLAKNLYHKPIYGVIGGLHFPVTASRIEKLGGRFQVQQYLGTGRLPWDPITKDDVLEQISGLKEYDPSVVSLSAHDSCDWSLKAFKDAFGDRYHELLVGDPIVI
ncbi:MAG: MBL fold metallo-hydrolase [Thermodesulfobacteriota bacterium]|nr:MBL fold metallo-hydrolase [Thermodesulfobacteriota bacterium]